jgi:hypothetical protein
MGKAAITYANLRQCLEAPTDSDYWMEEHLDHRHLVAAINGLFERDDFNCFSGVEWFEKDLIHGLANKLQILSYRKYDQLTMAECVRNNDLSERDRLMRKLNSFPTEQQRRFEISLPEKIFHTPLSVYGYPDFGLYVYRSDRIYLAIRCGSIGQNGRGGHAHNDQLSMELTVDGVDWITDPGTYVYTPLPRKRNSYRSVAAHFAPELNRKEPNSFDKGLFELGIDPDAQCHYFSRSEFLGSHCGYRHRLFRFIALEDERIVITDYTTVPAMFTDTPIVYLYQKESRKPAFSPSYGTVITERGG